MQQKTAVSYYSKGKILTIIKVVIGILILTDNVGSVFIFGDLVGLSTGLIVGEKEGYIVDICALKDRSEQLLQGKRVLIIKVEIMGHLSITY